MRATSLLWALDQVCPAATTDEVSFIAVPANIPKPISLSPSRFPNCGNKKAAITLNKNMTDMDFVMSSSEAEITGEVAAIADPPHMDEPTPTNMETLVGIFIILLMIYDTISAVEIVDRIIKIDCPPTLKISKRFIPNPNKIIAYFNIFFEVNWIPLEKYLDLGKIAMSNPNKIPMIGPPIIGNNLPISQAGTAISKLSRIPGKLDFIAFMVQLL